MAVVVGTLAFAAAEASAALEFCERAQGGRQCASLTVPFDRSGTVPGTVKLHIERQRAKRAARPPLFLIASPGQSSTDAFDSEAVDEIVGTEARSRDIVVMDMRGTGRSGVLDCPALQRGWTGPTDMAGPAAVAACAARLGARRDFYSSADMADDIDAVRAALGAERIAIYGVSYGTYVAQVYARRYPTRVDRLILDSVVGPTGVDALNRSSLTALPEAVRSLCGRRSCRPFLRDPGAAAARLAARLERRPLTGYVVDRWGRRRKATIDGSGLLDVATGYPLTTFALPTVVAAALDGDTAPLLRAHRDLARFGRLVATTPPRKSSVTATVATLCADTALPWSGTTPLEGRRAAALSVIGALPGDTFAPFGPATALESGAVETCLGWPSSSRAAAPASPLPDVPALLLAGGLDVETPVADAQAVQALLPRSELVVVPDLSSYVMQWDNACAGRALRRFLAGGDAGRCGRSQPDRAGLIQPPPPASLARVKKPTGLWGRRGRTVTAVKLTLIDGVQSIISTAFLDLALSDGQLKSSHVPRVGALRGGSYVGTRRGFILRRASLVSGVRVSGKVRVFMSGRVRGAFKVAGQTAAHGRLRLRRNELSGVIGGRAVSVRLELLERAFGIPSSAAAAAIRNPHAGLEPMSAMLP